MWIHVPKISSASVADTEELNLDSTQPWVAELVQSVTWKTNSILPRSLRHVWKTAPSIRLLSGLTCEPLTQSRGVAQWISSLEASRANHIQLPPRQDSEQTTRENLAGKLSESPTGLDFQSSFLKMSPESSDSIGTPFDPNYERWVIRLRRDYSQRPKQAHRTRGSDYSYWPTATQDSVTTRKERYAQGGNPLSLEAVNWPTVRTQMTRSIQVREDGYHSNLEEAVAEFFATPTARDLKGFDPPGKKNPSKDPQQYLSIPQAPMTTRDGHTCSTSCRRLNPRFVEMLMGLPQGWTDASEHLGTELFRAWQQELGNTL